MERNRGVKSPVFYATSDFHKTASRVTDAPVTRSAHFSLRQNGSTCLLRLRPDPRQTACFRVRLLSGCGAATRPFGDAFYMRRERCGEPTAADFPAPVRMGNTIKAGRYFLLPSADFSYFPWTDVSPGRVFSSRQEAQRIPV